MKDMIEKSIPTHEESSIEQKKKKIINSIVRGAKATLSCFGVDNLSATEEVKLRHIAEVCLEQRIKHDKDLDDLSQKVEQLKKENLPALDAKKQLSGLNDLLFGPAPEAAYRWLLELYNINANELPRCILVVDKTVGKTYKYINPIYSGNIDEFNKQQIEPFNKEKELKQMGHEVESESGQIEPEVKEYIRRLRERAHLI